MDEVDVDQVGLAQRARIVLLAAEGVSNTEIAGRVGCARQTVFDWRTRYEQSAIAGLDAKRPTTINSGH